MAEVTREEFREGLIDALLIVKKLAPLCESFDDLTGLIELAVGSEQVQGNAAQLTLLMNTVLGRPNQGQRGK